MHRMDAVNDFLLPVLLSSKHGASSPNKCVRFTVFVGELGQNLSDKGTYLCLV